MAAQMITNKESEGVIFLRVIKGQTQKLVMTQSSEETGKGYVNRLNFHLSCSDFCKTCVI